MLAGVISADHRELEAATRIQAHFRGRQVRARLNSKDDDNTEVCTYPSQLMTPKGMVSREPSTAQQVLARLSSRRARRSSILASPEEYADILKALEEITAGRAKSVKRLRIALYLLLEEPRSGRTAQVFSMVTLAFIILSISVFMLETMPELDPVPSEVWLGFEVVCTVVFTGEYIFRFFVCDVGGMTACEFLRRPMNLIDLFAILPFYMWLGMQSLEITKALGILRTVRLVRLFRVFKLGRYSRGLQLMIVALRNSSQALWVLSFFLGIGVVLFSSAIYYVEKMGCPDRQDLATARLTDGSNRTQLEDYVQECRLRPLKTNKYGICCTQYETALDFPTIIEAFWWSVVTMTTVGFGDVRPRTTMGRFVGTATMLSGILLIALPIAIIGRKFQEAYADMMESACEDEENERGAGTPCTHVSSTAGIPTTEICRKLKYMRLADASMANLARELAEGLEEVTAVQKEIQAMQANEQAKQLQAVEHFSAIVGQLTEIAKPSQSPHAVFAASAFLGKPKRSRNSTMVNEPDETPSPDGAPKKEDAAKEATEGEGGTSSRASSDTEGLPELPEALARRAAGVESSEKPNTPG